MDVNVRGGDVGPEVDLLVGRHDLVMPELEELRCELAGLGLLGNAVALGVVLLLELPDDLMRGRSR